MKGSYRKRGSTWSFQVELGRDPDTGKRLQKTKGGFKTKKEAEAACTEIINLHNKGQTLTNRKTTLGEFLDHWIDNKRDNLAKNTIKTYERHIRIHIRPELGEMELSKIRYTDIEKFQKKLLREKGLLARSVQDIVKILRSSLTDAVDKEIIYKNPTRLVKLPKIEKKKIQIWNDAEVLHFLETAKDDRLYIAFLIPLTTGMREGEVLGLKWDKIDFDRKTITVTETLSHDGKEIGEATKTLTSNRSIVISDTLITALRRHKKRINQDKLIASTAYKEHNLVVCTALGTPVIPRNCLRSLYRLAAKAELPRISYHDLRHTFATILLKSGVHPKIVSEILGHSSIRITMDTYSHVLPSMQLETAGKIDQIFAKAL